MMRRMSEAVVGSDGGQVKRRSGEAAAVRQRSDRLTAASIDRPTAAV